MLIPTLRDVDAAGLERNLKNAFLTISQSVVNAATPGNTLPQNSSLQEALSQDCLKQFSLCFCCCFSKGINLAGPPLLWRRFLARPHQAFSGLGSLPCSFSSCYSSLPSGRRCLSGKESIIQCRRCEFNPWLGKITWGRKWQPTTIFLPGKFHGQSSLVGYSPQGCKESDTTEQLKHTHTHRF